MRTRFRVPPPPRLPRAVAYAASLAIPAAVLAVDVASRSWSEGTPFVLFFLAVSASAWLGGPGPGLASVLASTAGGYVLLSTSSRPEHVASALTAVGPFLIVGAITAIASALARNGFLERERAAEALRQREAQLHEAVRVRDAFITIASHELKTPLTSAQLRLEHLARRCAEGPIGHDRALARTIAVLDRQLRQLGMLVNSVLDVSRIGAGRLRLELEPVDASELAREMAAQLARQVEESGAELRLDGPTPVVGLWDRLRLEQVVMNLLSNAVKYGQGKPIALSVRGARGNAEIEVRDEGLGIAQAEHVRVFERFERATHLGSGLGVGLWVVRELVFAHGGSVQLRSAPGRGSTFTVVLPLRPPRATSPTHDPATEVPGQLLTGHREVDVQHAAILAELHRMPSMAPDAVWASVAFLHEHFTSHFAFEELLMSQSDYPDQTTHRQHHLQLFERLGPLRRRLEREGATEERVREVADAAREWVSGHVMTHDVRLAEFLRLREARAAARARSR